jgi:hypothetical protein
MLLRGLMNDREAAQGSLPRVIDAQFALPTDEQQKEQNWIANAAERLKCW